MAVLIRTLLVWLLVLAVPAQGLAAATMAFCGPVHHGDGAVATAAHQHPGADSDTDVHPHAPAFDAAGTDSGGEGASADPHKCNVCGSCCSTGALMSTVPTLPAVDAASTAFASVVATIDPFAADGPDRPPRSLRA